MIYKDTIFPHISKWCLISIWLRCEAKTACLYNCPYSLYNKTNFPFILLLMRVSTEKKKLIAHCQEIIVLDRLPCREHISVYYNRDTALWWNRSDGPGSHPTYTFFCRHPLCWQRIVHCPLLNTWPSVSPSLWLCLSLTQLTSSFSVLSCVSVFPLSHPLTPSVLSL